MQILTIQGVENAINECIRTNPNAGSSIAKPTRALADIYGLMIFNGESEIDFNSRIQDGTFGEKHAEAIRNFYK